MALYTMKELLGDAEQKGYGIGFFNAADSLMLSAMIKAAEELKSPIIIGTAEGLLQYSPLDVITPMLLAAARKASVPVAVHLDHTYTFDVLMQALREGFGSVMYDGSRESYDDNVALSKEIARVSHAMGVGLECELGCVGGLANSAGNIDQNRYTDPDQAAEFVDKTGVDFLAVSIGTVHGVYKAEPKLDIPRLGVIHKKVDVPLVLHGGSGLSDDDFRNTIKGGIRKVNVYTDLLIAGRAAQRACAENANYNDIQLAAENAMAEAVKTKLRIFGSNGRA